MVTQRSKSVENGKEHSEEFDEPRSVVIAERGVVTARDFSRLMGALISDLVTGRISPEVGNAAVNAGGKMLKVVEMQHRYGRPTNGNGKTLKLMESEAIDAA